MAYIGENGKQPEQCDEIIFVNGDPRRCQIYGPHHSHYCNLTPTVGGLSQTLWWGAGPEVTTMEMLAMAVRRQQL